MTARRKTVSFFKNWQEPLIHLPLMTLLAFGAWIIGGALDRTATQEMLYKLVELPQRSLYAVAWLGAIYLARRRFRRQLTTEEQTQLWQGVMLSERGPMTVYLVDVAIWVLAGAALYPFFYSAL